MTFRVMAGISAIWAGNTKELKDGVITMPGTRHDVTEDVLLAATVWLAANDTQWSYETRNGTRYVLKVVREEVKE